MNYILIGLIFISIIVDVMENIDVNNMVYVFLVGFLSINIIVEYFKEKR